MAVPWSPHSGHVDARGPTARIAGSSLNLAGRGANVKPRLRRRVSRGALGRYGRTSHGAAKAGVIGMTRTWALELASDGITANVVSPDPVATEMFMRNNAELVERFAAEVPMGRLGEPDEIAAAIEFLLSRDASFVTGQVLHVCGVSSVGVSPL